MLSVLILTRNEELDLPGCLNNLCWCDDVVVYDSYSNDRTKSLAIASGARFIQRPGQDLSLPFGGDEAYHRTWALRQIPFKHPWVLLLDADERLPHETLLEIQGILGSLHTLDRRSVKSPAVAYQLRRRDYYQGRYLKHVQATPFYIRLFRPEFVHYERLVNPVTVVDGPVEILQGCIDHYPFSKGLFHWIERHNTYSTLEALERYSRAPKISLATLYGALFSQHFHQRRAHQKQLFMCVPARPLLKFAWLYFFKRGFLDSGEGFTYALLQSVYEYFIVLKFRELKCRVS